MKMSNNEGDKLLMNVSLAELDRSLAMAGSNLSSSDGGSGLAMDFRARFVPHTTLSVCCLLFNGIALAAICFVRGPRTVHHRLLANLTIVDIVGTVLLWLYYNSPCIFPRFEVNPCAAQTKLLRTAVTNTAGMLVCN